MILVPFPSRDGARSLQKSSKAHGSGQASDWGAISRSGGTGEGRGGSRSAARLDCGDGAVGSVGERGANAGEGGKGGGNSAWWCSGRGHD